MSVCVKRRSRRFELVICTSHRGFYSLRVGQPVRAYIDATTHTDGFDGPLFRALRHNGRLRLPRRHMNPDAIDRIVKKFACRLGLTRVYSAHSMRDTCITTALANGCCVEDVQRAAGHADPPTTNLFDAGATAPKIRLFLRQRLALAPILAAERLSALYASPLTRTMR